MLRNYFKIALRNLKRSKVYTLINVLGLALGIGCAILIFVLVKYHLSFDEFHAKKDRIYRIVTEFHQEEVSYAGLVPPPVGKAFRDDYTFAEKVARIAPFEDVLITVGPSGKSEKFYEENGVAFAERDFLDILDFPLIQGDKNRVLTEPNTAIITESVAKKYFSGEDPIGHIVRLDNRMDFRITGILRDMPSNTSFRQEIYLSYSSLKEFDSWAGSDESWGGVGATRCFVLLKPHVSPATVNAAFPAFSKKYYEGQEAEEFQFKLQHLSDIHFNTDMEDGAVSKRNLGALSLIGILLIITACVNFINLATAQALGRSREVGVRKALGSQRRQLFWQFISETALIAILAMILAFILARLFLPLVNQFFDTQLTLHFFQDPYLPVFLIILLLTVIFLAGSYPGLILSRLQPVLALKSKLSQRHLGGLSLRRSLVVLQFAISQLLVIGTLVIASQMRYSRQADPGFLKDTIVMLPVPDNQKSKISTLESQLMQLSGVSKVSFCNEAPAGPILFSTDIRYDGRPRFENYNIHFKGGDEQYLSTFELQLVAGRNLLPSDTIREYLINETAVKKLQVQSNSDVIGKKANINGYDGIIVGVIKDFHNKSFHEAIDPLCITTWSGIYFNCAIKINAADMRATLASIENTWKEMYPEYVYKYDFLDDRIAGLYEQDYRTLRFIQAFAGIAIVIGCLGLYGLVSFMTAQKTKEVGVRKVLGASVQSIIWLFGKEFTRLLLVAFVIAAPVAWWVMNNWLENFVYQIQIGAGIFALAILITLAVAVLTVGYRSIKAALMNPVKSLRSE